MFLCREHHSLEDLGCVQVRREDSCVGRKKVSDDRLDEMVEF